MLKSECCIVRRSNRIVEDVTLHFRKDLSKFVIVLEGTRKWYFTSQVQVRMQLDISDGHKYENKKKESNVNSLHLHTIR